MRVEPFIDRHSTHLSSSLIFILSSSILGSQEGHIARNLKRAGHERSVDLVADVMRQLGLRALQPHAYNRTVVADEKPVPAPNLIDQKL